MLGDLNTALRDPMREASGLYATKAALGRRTRWHLVSRSTLRIFRAEATIQWQSAVTAAWGLASFSTQCVLVRVAM